MTLLLNHQRGTYSCLSAIGYGERASSCDSHAR
jgi:hypothetical protein